MEITKEEVTGTEHLAPGETLQVTTTSFGVSIANCCVPAWDSLEDGARKGKVFGHIMKDAGVDVDVGAPGQYRYTGSTRMEGAGGVVKHPKARLEQAVHNAARKAGKATMVDTGWFNNVP